MSDRCPQDPAQTIAENLNAGNRDQAFNQISACNLDLLSNSDYARTMHTMGDKVLHGDPAASHKADGDFATLANQESQFWKSIQETARAANPAGLCKLTIEEQGGAPVPVLSGDKCN